MKKSILLIFTAFCIFGLFAQNHEAKGYVVDHANDKLVTSAKVSVQDTHLFSFTDSIGKFIIKVPKKHNQLLISKEGYIPLQIKLPPGFQYKTIKVRLKPLSELDSLRVTDSLFLTSRHAVSVSLLELLNVAVAVRYEWFINQKQSLGVHSSFYVYGRNPVTLGSEYDYYCKYFGIKLSPFYRYYLIRKKSFGLFAEGKLQWGYFYFKELNYHFSNISQPRINLEHSFNTIGGGISAGILFRLPKTKHGFINLSAGYQYFPIDVPANVPYDTGSDTPMLVPTNTDWWYQGGPGSRFDLKITIGRMY